jgi:HPt (histidine-containing phosphotransfer) domain-containing protein
MPEIHDAIRAQFKSLHQSYIAELPQKIARAREIWDQLPDDTWDDDAWIALHRLIHGLAGSGAIYGFPMISAAARALDIQLKAIVQEARTPGKKQQEELAALLDLVALAAQAPQQSGSPHEPAEGQRPPAPERPATGIGYAFAAEIDDPAAPVLKQYQLSQQEPRAETTTQQWLQI